MPLLGKNICSFPKPYGKRQQGRNDLRIGMGLGHGYDLSWDKELPEVGIYVLCEQQCCRLLSLYTDEKTEVSQFVLVARIQTRWLLGSKLLVEIQTFFFYYYIVNALIHLHYY